MDKLIGGQGYIVNMKVTDPRHYGSPVSVNRTPENGVVSDFSALFKSALQTVNDKQVKADNLVVQAATLPDTVDVHDVANALAEADLSLSFTKAIVDRAVRAYQEITTSR